MDRFKEIPNERIINYLVRRIGDYAAIYDQHLFNLMRRMSDGVYDGGLWDLRVYPNGAFAYILADSTIVPQVNSFNQEVVSCSLEALSFAVNLFVLGGLIEHAVVEQGRDDIGEPLIHCRDALKDALKGDLAMVIEPNGSTRAPTPEELAEPRKPHPEYAAIRALVD